MSDKLLTKDDLRRIRSELDTALGAVRDSNPGLTLRLGNCTFDPDAGSFVFKLEGLVEGGLNKDQVTYNEWRSFKREFEKMELPPLGSEITLGAGSTARRYTIEGMRARGEKLVAKNLADGKVYLLPSLPCIAAMNRAALEAQFRNAEVKA